MRVTRTVAIVEINVSKGFAGGVNSGASPQRTGMLIVTVMTLVERMAIVCKEV